MTEPLLVLQHIACEPPAAYEDERLPWLAAEKALIAEAVRARTPYWGVCLGAQLLASSLGARPTYRLFKVTLPMIAPYLIAAFGLSFALSMGELGATVMVYPPGWVTLPVAIFGLTDRGDIFSGAALTMILVAATLALLVGLERLPLGAVGRRA